MVSLVGAGSLAESILARSCERIGGESRLMWRHADGQTAIAVVRHRLPIRLFFLYSPRSHRRFAAPTRKTPWHRQCVRIGVCTAPDRLPGSWNIQTSGIDFEAIGRSLSGRLLHQLEPSACGGPSPGRILRWARPAHHRTVDAGILHTIQSR